MTDEVQLYIESQMEELGVDYSQLSDAVNIPTWRLKTGIVSNFPVSLPPVDYLKIAKALNLDPYEMFMGEQERRMRRVVRSRDLSDVKVLN